MSYPRTFVLVHDKARQNAIQAIATAPDGYKVKLSEPSRTLDQNAAMWPVLTAFENQVEWPVNGVMQFISDWEWKDLLTAAYRREVPRLAAAWDGAGVIMLGQRTRKFSKTDFSEWLEFLHACAAMKEVEL